MGLNLKKISATITENHHEALSAEASKRAVSISEILRRALDDWMDAKDAELREKATAAGTVTRRVSLADRKPAGGIK